MAQPKPQWPHQPAPGVLLREAACAPHHRRQWLPAAYLFAPEHRRMDGTARGARAAAPPRRRAAAPPRRRAACRATCRAAYHLASVLAPRHALGRPAAPASHTSPRCPLVARRPSRTPSSLLPSRQVWVNGRSASSSEVLAGALHDNCRASVVGSRSFGKGLIQGVFGLSDGGALVTTVASYATPNGREINLQGAAACSETRPPGCGRASHLRLEAPPLLRTVALCAPGRVWAAWARQCSPGATLRRRQRRWFRRA